MKFCLHTLDVFSVSDDGDRWCVECVWASGGMRGQQSVSVISSIKAVSLWR